MNLLRTDNLRFPIDDKCRYPSQMDLFRLPSRFLESVGIATFPQSLQEFICIKPAHAGALREHFQAADVFRFCEVRIKHPFMKKLILSHIAGVFTCFERYAGIGEQQPRAESDAEFVTPLPDVFIHRLDICAREPLRIGYPFRRRLRMQFKAQPVIPDVKIFF